MVSPLCAHQSIKFIHNIVVADITASAGPTRPVLFPVECTCSCCACADVHLRDCAVSPWEADFFLVVGKGIGGSAEFRGEEGGGGGYNVLYPSASC